jgi:O-antigen ligase
MGYSLGLICVVSSATRFRPPGAIGVGEALLLGWLGLRFFVGHNHGKSRSPWTIVLSLLVLLGTLSILVRVLLDGAGATDFNTYLPLLLSLFLAATLDSSGSPILRGWARSFPLWFVATNVGTFVVITARGLLHAGTYIGGVRFDGLTNNPNQLASFALLAGLVASGSPIRVKGLRGGLIGGAVFLVFKSQSDAAILGLFAGGAALVVAAVAMTNLPRRVRAIGVVAALAGSLVLASSGTHIVTSAVSQHVYSNDNQLQTRSILWKACLKDILGNPALGTGRSSTLHAFETRYECHNSYLDLALLTGIVGASTFALCLAAMAIKALRRRHTVLFAGLISLAAMLFANFPLRFPLVWVGLLYTDYLLQSAGSEQDRRKLTELKHSFARTLPSLTTLSPTEP